MTTDYSDFARDLADAAKVFARSLRDANDAPTHPDIELGAQHLDAIENDLYDLYDIDEDEVVEIPGIPGVLAESAAVARQVVGIVVDRLQGIGWEDAMTDLEEVVDRVKKAGFDAPEPSSLEWFGDDVPDDGSA
ncbi:hypothetical protein [Arthrobacter glacialis]|uniref:Uncharacterized protein n=1 Tax=Arthrobacter glacialis TaxID=1664 RepID=A0A2S3ZWK1_ARTGL|nr:hypothetical protein [Arthrobacter glacialis]POH73444.1 hypothetical protein CVS27_11090 [Arthrobacter glacialis]